SEYWRRMSSLIRTSRWAPAVNGGSSRPSGSTSSKEAISCASRVILLTRSARVVFASAAAASIVTCADIGCPLGWHSIGGCCHRYKRYFLFDLIQEFRYQDVVGFARTSVLMNLRQLETFYWVAKLGSFSAAADRLNATQSTVSMRIQDLERDFGHTLFDRGRRGARITAMGRELMRYAEEVLRLSAR